MRIKGWRLVSAAETFESGIVTTGLVGEGVGRGEDGGSGAAARRGGPGRRFRRRQQGTRRGGHARWLESRMDGLDVAW